MILNLTSQERKALMFVAGVLILGGVVKYAVNTNPFWLNNIKASQLSSQEAGKININTAGVEELTRIPGVGEVTAGKIILYRNQQGQFGKAEDLEKVKGIGRKKAERISKYIVVGAGPVTEGNPALR